MNTMLTPEWRGLIEGTHHQSAVYIILPSEPKMGAKASMVHSVKLPKRKGRLLLVEKEYMFAAEHGGLTDEIFELDEPYNKFSYIKDAVDDVIEKVLENGGDVEFVDKGFLKSYNQIALVKYY